MWILGLYTNLDVAKLYFLQMGGLEAVITGIMDEFKPIFKRWRSSREAFTAAVVVSAFLLAIPNVTNVSLFYHFLPFLLFFMYIFSAHFNL